MGTLIRRSAVLPTLLLMACGEELPEEFDAESGTYEMLSVGDPVGDCDFDPVGEDQSGEWTLDITVEDGAMSAEDESGPWDGCELSGIDFQCTPYAQNTDLSSNGVDAVIHVEASVSGSWVGAGEISGTYVWDVSCTGDDCQTVSDSGNFGVVPCSLSQAFTGTKL